MASAAEQRQNRIQELAARFDAGTLDVNESRLSSALVQSMLQ
jgi:hypothetical protein